MTRLRAPPARLPACHIRAPGEDRRRRRGAGHVRMVSTLRDKGLGAADWGARPMPRMRQTCESVAVNVPALLAAIAVGGATVTVVARRVSAFARQYVSDLEQDEAEAATSSDNTAATAPTLGAGPTNEATSADAKLSPSSGAAFEPTIFRARWLLTPASQAVLAAVLCGLTLAWGARSAAWAEVIVALPIVALLGAACSVDAVCHRLPNRILGPAALWAGAATLALLALNVTTGLLLADAAWIALRAALCAVCAGVIVGAMVLIPGSGMGLGDAKLCAVLGLWLGYFGADEAAMGIILGFFIGGVIAIALMISRLAGRKTLIAFGPYLAIGGWLSWMLAVA